MLRFQIDFLVTQLILQPTGNYFIFSCNCKYQTLPFDLLLYVDLSWVNFAYTLHSNHCTDWAFTTTHHLLHSILMEPVWHMTREDLYNMVTLLGHQQRPQGSGAGSGAIAGTWTWGFSTSWEPWQSWSSQQIMKLNSIDLKWLECVSMEALSLMIACSSAAAAAAYYSEPVLCPSVLQLTQTPTDDELLTGWWLRKATRGGVVMATEACQTDCVEIGQVWWTHNQ